uniref:F-box domain-containing protein n=1 Tax=viral metagenome TaxID=1070528 RepID=A0A6C0IJH1_9ZZZZ
MTGVFKSIKNLNNEMITLDVKHKEMINKFRTDYDGTKPNLENEKKEILKKLKNDSLSIDEQIVLHDKLYTLKIQLKNIKKAETDYLLNNSKYIFEYFENKKNIAECKNKTTLLEHFFNSKDNNEDVKTKEISYVNKYLTNINESCLDINNYTIQTDVCRFCNKGDLIPLEHEGILICNVCFKHTKYLIENEKPSYKEPPKEVCFYAYKRINHFREILAQFQAKETTQIPDEIIENITQQLKKERITLSQLTNKRTKDILKKLGYNKYYEHIPFIKDKLGIKPPIMSAELEITLCNLFMDIQAPYAKYCPDYRINFLNYYYTVYKLCELLDQQQFLSYFPMLKDREKRIEQDVIWKNICDELDWEFIPTV